MLTNLSRAGSGHVQRSSTATFYGLALLAASLLLDAPDTGAQIEEVIVTAQKKLESAQDVPIAITAFDANALVARQIVGFADFRFNAPNVTFAKDNFSASNIQIRGVGTTLTAASADAGVGIHVNDVPINSPRLFETEYFDIQSVEVLRGPQGTLFGRNATGGTVNMITAPAELGVTLGNVEAQYGEYDHSKLVGHVNLPLGDDVAVRLAGLSLQRDGYTENLFTGNDVDGRDQFALRASFAWIPTEATTVNLMASYFEEDSNRSRSTKTLCQNDPSALLGCLPDRLDFDLPNPSSQLSNILASNQALGPLGVFPFGSNNRSENPNDLRTTQTDFEPEYYSDETLVTLTIDHELDKHSLRFIGGYQDTVVDSYMDFLWSVSATPISVPPLVAVLFPETYATQFGDGLIPISAPSASGSGSVGGNIQDRLGTLESYDRSVGSSEQYTLEFQVASDYDGAFNWLAGVFYMETEVSNQYAVFSNGFDYLSAIVPGAVAGLDGSGWVAPYFLSDTANYEIESRAAFGEIYYEFNEDLKLTLGLRYTDDEKRIQDRQLLLNEDEDTGQRLFRPLGDNSPVPVPFRNEVNSWQELTGRAVLDWAVTGSSLLYASYSRGYKGGGFNPPFDPVAFPNSKPDFDPEFVDAYEIGSKNRFFNGKLQANATAFLYDYQDLQVSRIVNRTAFNENTDAEIYGLEAELLWAPDAHWLFNANLSYLKTEVQDFSTIDTRDPTAGRDDVTLIKDVTNGSNCVALVSPDEFAQTGQSQFNDCAALSGAGIPVTDGILEDLDGNRLQNSPEYSVSLGVEYRATLPGDHSLSTRLDYYWQDDMFARNFNREVDRIPAWDVWNAQVTLMSAQQSWYARAYVKNIADDNHLVGMFLSDPSAGLFTNVFAIEPRTYGVALGYNF
ncbi:MAG: TonB-dependent receptor [Halieaceae bacterium]|jgi:outer membrane receptor protein involved in Fe transport|nr:TonB-dependent receptor [Halieaceae bacterium]